MACSKYILTNTGSTIITFNYQKCEDTQWQYQIELEPNQTKNIWLINNTFEIAQAFSQSIVLENTGTFPPTPTPSPQTPTPTPTLTHTPTPTNVERTIIGSLCHSESDSGYVCTCPQTATIAVNGTTLANSTLAWSDAAGPNTGDPVGYYLQGGIIYQVSAGCGPGCITGSTITALGPCATPTPTPTPTGA